MYRLSVKYHFDAAHSLREYHGKCSRLHGHRWEIEAVVSGDKLDKCGMLIDFSLLKGTLKKILEDFDHYNLNDIEPFNRLNPTAENLSRFLFERLKAQLPEGVNLSEVKVWESPDAMASYSV